MSMRILILNGSPNRARGMTGQVVAAFAEGATGAGAEVAAINLYDRKIGGCLGCFACWTRTPGVCSQRDDMDELLDAIRSRDALVLASPVYVDGMTGVTKMAVDRMIPLVHGATVIRDGHMRHVKRATTGISRIALLSVCGFVERDNFDPMLAHARGIAGHLGCAFGGAFTMTGGLRQDSAAALRALAREAGSHFARYGHIPERLSEAASRHSLPADQAAAGLNRYFDQPACRAGGDEPPA
jgi:multimeric flavodoxin WrbA